MKYAGMAMDRELFAGSLRCRHGKSHHEKGKAEIQGDRRRSAGV